MEDKHRGAYERAAAVGAACADVVRLRGDSEKATAMALERALSHALQSVPRVLAGLGGGSPPTDERVTSVDDHGFFSRYLFPASLVTVR